MTAKARLWIGITLLIVIAINYALIGFPMMSKSLSIQNKAKAILVKQAKSTNIFKNSDDEYMLEVFRREKAAIETKITVLNSIATTVAFIVLSWTLFGLIFRRW
ncbi:MAG: hypothetical protein NC938_04515 [Candidatus Omnitrophica bacterium]|nr:hypothetical protein [Candidatus Omnitrophota bacterium]MCM8790946.1 hypothetical protein [Candidatus Omnitrophota bacterium]